MKRTWYLIPAALVCAAFVLAVIVRFSYTDTVAGELSTYEYAADNSLTFEDIFEQNGITSPEDLVSRADLAAKVRFDGERTVRSDAFYSAVEVEEVYKGDPSLLGQTVIVTETVSTFQQTRFLNASAYMKLWVPLEEGCEYIVLLQKIPFSPQRELNDLEQRQYYPVTNSPAGCYLVEDGKSAPLQDGMPCTLDTLKGYPLYAFDQQQVDAYYALKETVLPLLGAA